MFLLRRRPYPGMTTSTSPLVEVIQEHNLSKHLPNYTLTDLYLFVSDYQWLLREAADNDLEQSEISREMSELVQRKRGSKGPQILAPCELDQPDDP